MPTDGIAELQRDILDKIIKIARCSQTLQQSRYILIVLQMYWNYFYSYSLDVHIDSLRQEIGLDFTRAMNKIMFDKTIMSNPAAFPFVVLPEPEQTIVPAKGTKLNVEIINCYILFLLGKHPDVPPFPFDKIRQKFKFLSLLTFPEVISALVSIKEECERLSDMSLFHTGTGKPLKLEEFDQAQGQASMQVSY